jgi:hypoxanthine-DNA glycosylase
VYGACERQGSADSAIRDARANRFARLRRLAPRLVDIAFNGRTAGRFAPALAAGGFRTTILPSSSPANASFSYRQKLAVWRTWWLAPPPVSGPGPAVR